MLIPVYHIVASQFAIAASTTFEQGHVAAISSTGYVVKCDGDQTNGTQNPIGLAGDKNRPAVAYEFQNRVSDFGNDTRASGLMTIYHSGGEFWVDMDDDTVQTPDGTAIDGVIQSGSTVTPGTKLYASDVVNGHLDNDTNNAVVALVVGESQELTTGIPGEFEPGVTFPLADDTDNKNFVKIKLLI